MGNVRKNSSRWSETEKSECSRRVYPLWKLKAGAGLRHGINRCSALIPIICCIFASYASAQSYPKGEVTIPLDEWDSVAAELRVDPLIGAAPISVAHIDRRIEGRFQKGLFRGTMIDRFEVQDASGYVQVPLLDGSVSLGAVSISGKGTSLFKENEMYTLGVEQPGIYEVKAEFFWGQDNDRFARGLRFRLPEGSVTALSAWVPETDIEPVLSSGVITKTEMRGKETLVEGRLDSSGIVDLSWTRKVTHRADREVSLEAALSTVFTFQEATVTGVSVFNYLVKDGETDFVELSLPEGVEVVKVEGDSVLQWAQESKADGRLTVLLRHLVSDAVRIYVYFQMPLDIEKPVLLKMPLPKKLIPFTAYAGVQGPLGFKIKVADMTSAIDIPLQNLPRELTELTDSPLLFGFSCTAVPNVTVQVTRHAQIELTFTLVEEIQASTVQMADGMRITKMRFRIRNNTRETMQVTLPDGAILTHAFLEGSAVRPFLPPFKTASPNRKVLLFPLRQSERLVDGEQRIHMVRPGETLSDIANFYYSNPTKTDGIQNANPGINPQNLIVGQALEVPLISASKFEESTFVIEIAYKEKVRPLGMFGEVKLSLPELDVDVMEAVWHVYLPNAVDPLSVTGNLVQYSSIRYDPFRRVRDYLMQAMFIRNAWAGGDYQNILKSRKAIFQNENIEQSVNQTVRSAFPLVGRLYKFKRILLQKDIPTLSMVYADRIFATFGKVSALIIGFVLTLLMVKRSRDWKVFALSIVVLGVTLVIAHYFLGMHRRLLWGADLALLFMLITNRGAYVFEKIREHLFSPWQIIPMLTLRNLFRLIGLLFILAVTLLFPLLLSAVLFIVLLRKLRRESCGQEVTNG